VRIRHPAALHARRTDRCLGKAHRGARQPGHRGDPGRAGSGAHQRAFPDAGLGAVDWVFAVAPTHPLASATEPLSAELVRSHRAIAVGDNSQSCPR
jgi:hypothetical protein